MHFAVTTSLYIESIHIVTCYTGIIKVFYKDICYILQLHHILLVLQTQRQTARPENGYKIL